MLRNRIRAGSALSVAVAALAVSGAGQAAAQTTDVAGKWNLEVTTDQGVTNPSFTLEQDGGKLSGRYSSETLGEHDLTGSVDGSSVTISFSADIQGQPVSVLYRGTVDEEGKMSGILEIADGAFTGTFTAMRTDG